MTKMPVVHWRRLIGWDNILSRSSSTSWLDGLRGVAALQVFFFHFFGRHIVYGHTYGSSEKDYYLHQLPLFRIVWAAGSGAVSTFFVISGYAITVKSLSLLRQRKYDDLFNGLCSSIFRRGFRLYLPVYLLAIPSFFLIRIFDVSDGFLMPKDAQDMETWGGQFVHFLNNTDTHVNPFGYRQTIWECRYAYVPTAWTIPMEFYGSIVCYVMMMVLARIQIFRLRSLIVGGMCFYAIHHGSWWTSNFLFGMWMADSTLEQKAKFGHDSKSSMARKGLLVTVYTMAFFFGLYLSSMPPEFISLDFSPQPKVGYMWLYKLYPPQHLVDVAERARWYWYLSGNLTFLGVSKIHPLQTMFNTKLCQWLGKISFALYLVHAIVIAVLSRRLQNLAHTMTEHKGLVCLFEFTLITPVILVFAGLVERYIDQPSVRCAKWLEQQVFSPQGLDTPVELSERPFIVRDPEGHTRPAN